MNNNSSEMLTQMFHMPTQIKAKMDKGFEDLNNLMDRMEWKFDSLEVRFDALETKFNALETIVDNGFTQMVAWHDERF